MNALNSALRKLAKRKQMAVDLKLNKAELAAMRGAVSGMAVGKGRKKKI